MRFAITIDINKCLIQIKLPISVHTGAPIAELPSDISTMKRPETVDLTYAVRVFKEQGQTVHRSEVVAKDLKPTNIQIDGLVSLGSCDISSSCHI